MYGSEADNKPQNSEITNQKLPEVHRQLPEVLAKFRSCVRAFTLYSSSHPVARQALDEAYEAVKALLAHTDRVSVLVADDRLFLGKFPVEDRTGAVSSFADDLRARGITAVSISSGITPPEVGGFAEAFCLKPGEEIDWSNAAAEFRKRGITHIRLETTASQPPPRPSDAADAYENALDSLGQAMSGVGSGRSLSGAGIAPMVCRMFDVVVHEKSALLALTAIRSYDNYLLEHSVNVSIVSMLLALDLGLEKNGVLDLGMCAMLHDIGKVFLPEEIIKKPGKLSEQEWEQVRRHPIEGAKLLAGASNLPVLAPTVAYEHHIRKDATGYPAIPEGHKPHLLSQIVSLADVYDALTADRPYRQKWTPEEAVGWMIYESPGWFDERLLARFASRAGMYPIGSLVKLKNGSFGVVVGGSYTCPTSPKVMIVSGSGAEETDRRLIDLAQVHDASLTIEQAAEPVEALLPCSQALLAA